MEDRHPDLVCPICQELFTDCVQTPCCENGFCVECLDSSLKATNGTCPSCRKAISVFQCVPNKMVQRMVDNLPAECNWCDAKLTRSIYKEHLQKCEKRPDAPVIVNNANKCPVHAVDLSLICMDDDVRVCAICALVGKYRYRDCTSLKMYEAVKNVAGLSLAIPTDLSFNKSTLLYWINTGLKEIVQLHFFANDTNTEEHPSEAQEDTAQKSDDTEFTKVVKLVSLATWLCFEGKKELTKENIFEVLKTVLLASPNGPSISLEHPMLRCIDDNRIIVFEFLSGRKPTSTPEQTDAQASSSNSNNNNQKSALSDEEEYQLLKEKYDNEHFNFSGLQVRTLPLCDSVVRGHTNHIPVLVELRSGKMKEEDKEKRPPFSLALVLDRSGSMAGSKMDCANEAVINCIKSLLPGDLLHLVTFDSTADVVFENGTLDQAPELISKVRGISARGSTGMTRGLSTAFNILKNEKEGRTRKIFVFSDGVTDEGNVPNWTLVEQFFKEGVGVSSFGIGTDFDEKFMKAMADKGHGNYFFIDSPQNAPKFVDKAFRGLSRTVATDVVLKIRGNHGCKVSKLNAADDLFKGILLNDLREKDLKQVVLEVEVPKDACGNLNSIDVFSLEISYTRIGDHVPEGPYRGDLKLTATDDWDVCNQFNDDVLVFLKISECSQLDKVVAQYVDAARYEDAVRKKQRVIEILKDIADKDSIGFAKVMLLRAKDRVKDLQELRVNRSKREMIRKRVCKEAEEEEDADMGFGLFD